MSFLVGFKRINCSTCDKIRHHETMFNLAKCVTCGTQRDDINDAFEIERFID